MQGTQVDVIDLLPRDRCGREDCGGEERVVSEGDPAGADDPPAVAQHPVDHYAALISARSKVTTSIVCSGAGVILARREIRNPRMSSRLSTPDRLRPAAQPREMPSVPQTAASSRAVPRPAGRRRRVRLGRALRRDRPLPRAGRLDHHRRNPRTCQPRPGLAALETALGHDPYNEYLYQRIMRLQAAVGRPDAVRRTLRLPETGSASSPSPPAHRSARPPPRCWARPDRHHALSSSARHPAPRPAARRAPPGR
jgi:hypothetical protein